MEFCTDSIIAPSRHVYGRFGLPAVIHTWCGECPVRAQLVPWNFALRALAARKPLQALRFQRRRAAAKSAIRRLRRNFKTADSQVAGQTSLLHLPCSLTSHRFALAAGFLLRCDPYHRSGHCQMVSVTSSKPQLGCMVTG
ncbi:MAG: hypothetical protein HWE35_08405 [Rhodobacteraceae bacterium]|nr:hypothetical protein [Paracoccaceae bacterium]